MAARVIWEDPATNLLVSERRRRNDEYHMSRNWNRFGQNRFNQKSNHIQ
jgi:hypothetical protein